MQEEGEGEVGERRGEGGGILRPGLRRNTKNCKGGQHSRRQADIGLIDSDKFILYLCAADKLELNLPKLCLHFLKMLNFKG